MTIEFTILLSIISVAAAVFFGLSTRARNKEKDVEEDAENKAAIMVKLENIQTGQIEMKTELKGYREEVRRVTEQAVRNEESLRSLHKRVDRMENYLKVSPIRTTNDEK